MEKTNKVTNQDFINAVAEKTGLTKKDSRVAIDAVLEVIVENLGKGKEVSLPNHVGKFVVTERAERKGRNPQTGEEITIPAHNSVSFKAGKTLKDAIK